EEQKDAIGQVLQFINIFLYVFVVVALVVGSFLIVNTFSILVAQRARELALLRALGASRRQVRRLVLLEALAIALIGSTVGVGGRLRSGHRHQGDLRPDRARPVGVAAGFHAHDAGLVVRRRHRGHDGRGIPAGQARRQSGPGRGPA
ncbi:MAG: FtsX-like permease family protein, partial [Actinomycetota bacterium]|nr:FtsX-like permease family protein [Actinomycetota bacterium]